MCRVDELPGQKEIWKSSKTIEKESPSSLTWVKAFSFPEKLEVILVSQYCEGVSFSLKSVSPFFKYKFDGKDFSITDVIVPLRRG